MTAQIFDFTPTAKDRLPPQNIEAEEAVLGGILLDANAMPRVVDILEPEAFYVSHHATIYRAAQDLYNAQQPVDLQTVTNRLSDRNQLATVGGKTKMAQLVDRTVSAVNIDALAMLLREKAVSRRMIAVGNEISTLGYDQAQDLSTRLDSAEQRVFALRQGDRDSSKPELVADISVQVYQQMEHLANTGECSAIATGFYDLDDLLAGGLYPEDLIIVGGRPSMGKCAKFDTQILLGDGSITTIQEVVEKRTGSLLTLNSDWKLKLTKPSNFIDSGVQEVFKVQTRLGRQIETTITHPYLTVTGWQKLASLKPGDKIAVPRKMEVFGTERLRECEVKLIAYLIGDGCLLHGCVSFTKDNPVSQNDFCASVFDFSPSLKLRVKTKNGCNTYFVSKNSEYVRNNQHLKRQDKNAIVVWLESLGMMGIGGHKKFVPDIVFKLERPQLALFLNRLFATDGWATVLASGQCQLGYCSVSEKLIRQVQHLLLRFGIIASIKNRSVKYQGGINRAWQIDITDSHSIKTFIDEIGITGRESAVSKVMSALSSKRYQTNRDLIPVENWDDITRVKGNLSWSELAQRAGFPSSSGKYNIHVGKRAPTRERLLALALALENQELQQLATSDVYWDEIVEIEPAGVHQVYDLTIPKTHNFIANDICIHNSLLTCSIAYQIAALKSAPTLIFSLEMSKEAIVQRFISNLAEIKGDKLRQGKISGSEWVKVAAATDTLSRVPVLVDDTPCPSVQEIRSKVRSVISEYGGLKLVAIDYLQLMIDGADNRSCQRLGEVTRLMKLLARECKVPIILLSQLNRGVEERSNKRPMMSDIRESGRIEEDADVILFPYRDEYYNNDTLERGVMEIICTKHRNGPTGTVKLLFDGTYSRLRNLTTVRGTI